jgi:hypothetical protein
MVNQGKCYAPLMKPSSARNAPPPFGPLLLPLFFLASCQSGIPLQEGRDPRLDNLGLVYDDTIVTTSGRTVDFNGQGLITRLMHTEKSGGGSELSVNALVGKVVFGLDRDFTLALSAPYFRKRRKTPSGSILRSEGLGDSSLVGKYRFFQETGRGKTLEASVLFGLELPTGSSSERSGGSLLPIPLQPGSGSVDGILGVAATKVEGRWLVSADLIAKLNGEAKGYRLGHSLRADLGGHFRLYPARYERFDQKTLNLVAELNSLFIVKDKSGGTSIGNTGGNKLFGTLGMQWIFNENFLLEAAVQLPLLLDLNGNQMEEDWVSIFGFRLRF